MPRRNPIRRFWLVTVALALAAPLANAQTYKVLYNFGSHQGDPVNPGGVMAQGRDGSMYGVSAFPNSVAMYAYKITRSGALTTLAGLGGDNIDVGPFYGLTLGTDGSFYGTTLDAGTNGVGSIYKLTVGGGLTTLYDFTSGPGGYPYPAAPPIQGIDGNYYGTTQGGGSTNSNCDVISSAGCGTLYEITPSGEFTTLHAFDGTDGVTPFGSLVQGTDGNFYGVTDRGGLGAGTLFRIGPSGEFAVLYNFESNAPNPVVLTQSSDGSFYLGALGSIVFKISHGVLTGPWELAGYINSLIEATDGNFYGTVENAPDQCGSVFRMSPDGVFSTLHTFTCSDGYQPDSLVQRTDGLLYGTTAFGGSTFGNCCGEVGDGVFFSLDIGAPPFVTFLPAARQVGHTVEILGQGLTGTTGVSFNGTPATTFNVYADTYMTANVPDGATTGFIIVSTPTGTLTSNKKFQIKPQITGFSPASGAVGASVVVSGVSLSQTSKITFGSVVASNFTVNSDTQVTATVPAGATTAKIGVTTTGAPVYSATAFTVTQ